MTHFIRRHAHIHIPNPQASFACAAWGMSQSVMARALAVLALLVLILTVSAAEVVPKTWFVSTNGNDSLAVPDDPGRPFLSIQSAISAATNGDTVLVRPGRYVVTPGYSADPLAEGTPPPLLITNRVDFTLAGEGEGVEIIAEGKGDSLMVTYSTNIVIRNLVFRGNRPEVEPSEVPFVFPTLMLYGYNTNILIQGCQFLDFGNHGISHLYDPKASEAVTIMNCRFENGGDLDAGGIGEEGAAVSGIGSRWTMTNNLVVNCVRGFEVEGNAPTAVSNIVIRGNVVTNCTNLGVMLFANSGESWRYRDILIADNQFYRTYRSTNSTAGAILITGGEDLMISNNVVRFTSNIGIAVNAHLSDLKRCVVASNIVEQSGTRGIQVFQFEGKTVRDVQVVGNVVRFSGDSGILAEGVDILVQGNECQGNAAFSKRAGIELSNISGQAGHMVVRENNIWIQPAYSYQDLGIWIREGVVGALIFNNRITVHPEASILDEGIGTDYGAPPRPSPVQHALPRNSGEGQIPASLADTGLFASLDPLQPSPGLYPYDVNVPSWNYGAAAQRWVRAPDVSSRFGFSTNSTWKFPAETLWIQHLTMPRRESDPASSRPVETRVLMVTTNGAYGVSYRWNEAGTGASMVEADGGTAELSLETSEGTTNFTWRFPSRQDCMSCHTVSAGYALGFNTAQLNRDSPTEYGHANQLRVLTQAGFIDRELKVVDDLPSLSAPGDDRVDVNDRVRSYLAANCAGCHRPGGTPATAWDARFEIPLVATGLLWGELKGPHAEDPDRRLVTPGSLLHSELHQRVILPGMGHALGALHAGANPASVRLIESWITETLVRPVVETLRAEQVNARIALALASVKPNATSGPVQVWFEWGLSTNYGLATPPMKLAPGMEMTGVGWFLEPLAPETIYHYRVAASNVFGITRGEDSSFITAGNRAPVAVDDLFTARKDFVLSVPAAELVANDTDPDYGDSVSLGAVAPFSAKGGTVSWEGSTLVYSPPVGLVGEDEFTYETRDLSGASSTGRALITLILINTPPVAQPDAIQAVQDTDLVIEPSKLLANDNDPDPNDRITLSSVTLRSQAGGRVIMNGGQIIYTPPADFTGTDRFSYTITDLGGGTAVGSVVVTVVSDYQPPRISALEDVRIPEHTALWTVPFRLATDPRAHNRSVQVHSSNTSFFPDYCLWFSGSGDQWRLDLRPPANRSGETTITISLSDGREAAEASFKLTVTPVDDAPVANDDVLAVESAVPRRVPLLSLLANDTDPDPGSHLRVKQVDSRSKQGGTIEVLDDGLVYTSAPGFIGSDAFDYIVEDETGLTAKGQVVVSVEHTSRLDSVTQGAGHSIVIRWIGVPGRSYQLLASDDLTRWEVVAGLVAAADGGVTFQEPAERRARYYRLLRIHP